MLAVSIVLASAAIFTRVAVSGTCLTITRIFMKCSVLSCLNVNLFGLAVWPLRASAHRGPRITEWPLRPFGAHPSWLNVGLLGLEVWPLRPFGAHPSWLNVGPLGLEVWPLRAQGAHRGARSIRHIAALG